MTTLYKFIIRAALICFLVTTLCSRAKASQLTIYAGPQSVSAQEMIYVSVETAALEVDVKLSYITDGKPQTLTGITQHGLVSFDVPAQKLTGVMRFLAQSENSTSNEALVTVIAGPPLPFSMTTTKSQQSGSVDIGSDVIADKYGNVISSLSLSSIDWIDAGGMIASQSAQLIQGRIALTTQCPTKFTSPVKIRAKIHSATFTSADVSDLCRLEKE